MGPGADPKMRGKMEDMSAKELKEALSEAQVDCSDCFEKADLRNRLSSHLAKLNEDRVMKKKHYANNAFARGSFAMAIRFYSDALNLLEEGGGSQLVCDQIYSNKSLTFLKMNQADAALRDARSCDPSFAKGWLRRANALSRLGESDRVTFISPPFRIRTQQAQPPALGAECPSSGNRCGSPGPTAAGCRGGPAG